MAPLAPPGYAYVFLDSRFNMHCNVFYLWFLSNTKMSVLTQKVSLT